MKVSPKKPLSSVIFDSLANPIINKINNPAFFRLREISRHSKQLPKKKFPIRNSRSENPGRNFTNVN
ncbi:MAG: hypothetical protein ACTSO2_20025, partial [Promethearchaeota archaeon]